MQEPKDKSRYETMVNIFRGCDSKDQMGQTAALLFIPDLQYPREDICLALAAVEREKRWTWT